MLPVDVAHTSWSYAHLAGGKIFFDKPAKLPELLAHKDLSVQHSALWLLSKMLNDPVNHSKIFGAHHMSTLVERLFDFLGSGNSETVLFSVRCLAAIARSRDLKQDLEDLAR